MLEDEALDGYQRWLYEMIRYERCIEDHWELLLYLSGKEFTWSVKRDVDRERDGFELRENYAMTFGIDPNFWIGKMPNKASILEVMIALATRCNDITYAPEVGDLTPMIFWQMINSLGLWDQNWDNFNKYDCDFICNRFLERRYSKDGSGGLFRTLNKDIDMRKSEIWRQMGVWISENFEL